MFVLNGKKIKRIFFVFFLICFFILCSCRKEAEKPKEEFNINFVINGHGEELEVLMDQTNLPDPLPELSEEGWEFKGWYRDNETFEDRAMPNEKITEDITLYAKWTEVKKFSITYVINGHGKQPANLKNQTTLPDPLPELIEEGWIFEGWYFDDITFQNKAEEGTALTDNVTLYAKWTEVKKYSITFVTNGHGKQPENLTNQTHLPDPLPELNEKLWIFEGWFTDRYFGTPATAGDAITKNTTLYAKWRGIPTVAVIYKINNEEGGRLIGETEQVIEIGTDTTPVTVVTNIGYKFIGWSVWGREPEGANELTRVDKNVQSTIIAEAILQAYTCYLDFQANAGGRVEGATSQEVLYGDKGETVTAIPDKDFRFVRWSDGETDAIRTNDCVTHGADTIYAEFERCERTFKLEYNEATSNTSLIDYTFYLDDMEKEQYLPVPQREGYEFMGWYSDWFHTVQVTDETGRMIVDRVWFNNDWIFYDRTNPDMKLFARWKPTKEVPVYKILMIYVTEVHATLETSYYGTIQVDYVMTDIEKEFYELLSLRMEEYLEAILNGTVDFQVDTYFTKESLTEKNFYRGSTTLNGSKFLDDFGIDVERGKMPEVNEILDNYDSVITSFHLNDDENKLHATAGSASKKYGDIHSEFNGTNFEQKFDLTSPGIYYGWVDRMSLYIHEFTHTVEFQLQNKDYFDMHGAIRYYSVVSGAVKTSFDVLYDYLRNEFKVEDRYVGIPYEFWTEEYERK